MSENKRDKKKTRLFSAITEKCTYKANKYRHKSLYLKLFKTEEDLAWKGLKEVEKSEESGFTKEDTDFKKYKKYVQDWKLKLEEESELNKDSNWENLSNYPGWDDFRKELNLIEDDEKYILLNGIALTSIRHVFGWRDDDEDVRNKFLKIVDKFNEDTGYPEPYIRIIKSIIDFWYEDGLFNEIKEEEKKSIYKLMLYDIKLDCKSRLSAAYAYYTQTESMDDFSKYIEELCSIYFNYFDFNKNQRTDPFNEAVIELNKRRLQETEDWKINCGYLVFKGK